VRWTAAKDHKEHGQYDVQERGQGRHGDLLSVTTYKGTPDCEWRKEVPLLKQ
jgi:hypothetical protein